MAVKTVFFLYLFCLWLQVQAQQGSVVLTSIGEQCFGQKVTLTCTHSDPFQDPAKYLPVTISWAEDGVGLDFSLPATRGRFTPTRLNSTASTLSFTVTEEFHANRVVNCSCFLVLNGDSGGREESDPIIMDVNETIQSPTIMSKPDSTSGLLQWNSPSSSCSNYQYIFTLIWVRIGDGSTGTVSTAENRYDFTGMPGGAYNVSLKARVTNFNLIESQPVHDCWIKTIQPPTILSTPDTTSGLLRWRPSPSCSNYQYNFTLTWVRIGDGSTDTVSTEENRYDFTGMPGGEYTALLKTRVTNFNLIESQPAHDCWITIIQPPTLVSTPDGTSGLLQWRPSSSCSNYRYIFTLTWVRMEDNSNGTVTTAENRYDFTGMPEGNYIASITAAIVGLNLNESEPLIVPPFTASPAGGITVAITIVLVVVNVIVVIITLMAIIVVICCCRNKKKRISQSCSPVTESEYSEAPNKKQEAENVELGQTRQELDKKQEAENDQIQYAAIDFSGQRPIAPPSLETVVYTETVEQFRKARKNRPIPPLPPAKTEEEEEEERKLAQEAAEITADFKAQVVAILQASKLVYRTLDPEEPVVGTYQKKTFVASFVHAPGGKEILSSEVEAIIKARQLQSTDKGFLVATTDSISGPWLEYLEKHNCHFIGLSRKGGVKKEMLLKKLSLCFPESSSF